MDIQGQPGTISLQQHEEFTSRLQTCELNLSDSMAEGAENIRKSNAKITELKAQHKRSIQETQLEVDNLMRTCKIMPAS